MFPPRSWTLEWMTSHCHDRFGVTPNPTFLVSPHTPSWGLRPSFIVAPRRIALLGQNGAPLPAFGLCVCGCRYPATIMSSSRSTTHVRLRLRPMVTHAFAHRFLPLTPTRFSTRCTVPVTKVDRWGFNKLAEIGVERIVFTNGMNDGWSAGSVTKNLSSQHPFIVLPCYLVCHFVLCVCAYVRARAGGGSLSGGSRLAVESTGMQ
jgi:hypothetical protein